MFYWSQIPLVRMVLPMLMGIILFRLDSNLFSLEFLLLFLLLLLYILFISFFRRNWLKYKQRWFFGLHSSFVFIILGYGLAYVHQISSNTITDVPKEDVLWIGEVKESLSKTAKSIKTVVEINHVVNEEHSSLKNSKTLLYIKQDTNANKIKIGDLLLGNSNFNQIEGAQNPAQFDYSKFMANRSIYLQSYLQDWEKVGSNDNLHTFAAELRTTFLEVFRKAGLEGNDFAVASALTLGYDNELDYQMKNAFSGAGAMHILSVSGLHVGIIYLVLTLLTQFMKKSKSLRFLRCLLLLSALWFYALITGISPPVQRSAFMFSFIVLADYFGRNNNIFNSLAASILVLILINPNIIFEVGFQLSYSAVIGIVLIHPKIYPLLEFDFWLLDKIWNLMVVSIAAQLATLPFALFYFHQFPNWFLLTNIIVVPLAFIILVTAVSLLILYSLFSTTIILGTILKFLVAVLNQSVLFFYQLPFSVTDDIHIPLLSTILVVAAILSFILYLYYYRPKYILLSVAFLSIISIEQLWEYENQKKQSLLTFYDIRNKFAISSIEGKKAVVLANFNKLGYSSTNIKNHLSSLGVNETEWVNMDSVQTFKGELLFYKKGKKAIYISSKAKNFIIPTNDSYDLKSAPNVQFENLFISENRYDLKCYPASNIVFNPSIPEYQRKWMLKDVKLCGVKIISEYKSFSWNNN